MTNATPSGIPLPGISNDLAVLLAYINIKDTNTHTYRTDNMVPYAGSYYGIGLLHLGNAYPSYKSYSIYILNNENQPLNVSVISNIVGDGSLPDMNLLTLQSPISSGDPYQQAFSFEDYPADYISLSLNYSTAPTGLPSPPTNTYPVGVIAWLLVDYR